jgi:hypothetical protein
LEAIALICFVEPIPTTPLSCGRHSEERAASPSGILA